MPATHLISPRPPAAADAAMASFARSFKPPASYLSPVRRPGMPGRTISNSSDLSLTSNASGPPADDNSREQSVSAPDTPYLSGPEDEQRASSTKSELPESFFVSLLWTALHASALRPFSWSCCCSHDIRSRI